MVWVAFCGAVRRKITSFHPVPRSDAQAITMMEATSGMTTGPQVRIETRKIDTGETQVAVLGEVDLATAPAFEKALKKVRGRVVVDLRKVEFMDSTGIRVILTHRERLEAAGGHLRAVATKGPVLTVLEIAGVLEMLEVTDSLTPRAPDPER